MDSHTVLLALRIAVLVVLWIFVFVAVRSLAKTVLAGRAAQAPSKPKTGEGITHLVFTTGPLAGSYCDLAGIETVTLGRAADCAVQVTDDFASSHHARLFHTAAGWFVEDLASRNGTAVDGVTIEAPEQVGPGSEITIGQTTVRLAP